MSDVVNFLRNLTYGENSTSGLKETFKRWEKIKEGVTWLE